MSIDDGGPAFPCASEWGVGEAPFVQGGMTLRQWYAGQALAGMLAWDGYARPKEPGEVTAEIFARSCLELADALIAAEKTSTGQ